MPILIDGHNLIPKIPGLYLSDIDDEMRLVQLLQSYSRLRSKGPIECYFDKAPQGDLPRVRRFGKVRVQFARRGDSADAEIERRLVRLGRQARNWLVVSSDQRLRQAAQAAGARHQSSENFASELMDVLQAGEKTAETPDQPDLSAEELDFWLKQFRRSSRRDES